MIISTQPFLPPKDDYFSMLSQVWQNKILTNMGAFSMRLENELIKYLNVENASLLYVSSGTIALQLSIKALGLKGDIITTPYSFVATTSAIVWENCTPVFVDINPDTLNIDPSKIEQAITPNTCAIIATHLYGNPCDVEALEKIAKKNNLKLIYDGAHAFDVKINNRSIFSYGDVSICSLHATKIVHTAEGGFIVTKNEELFSKMCRMRNFGFSTNDDTISQVGINAKNSELHAALGLCNLQHIHSIFSGRKNLFQRYTEQLKSLPVQYPHRALGSTNNYAYYPVIFESEEQLLLIEKKLIEKKVYARRFFYPSLDKHLPYVQVNNNCKNAQEIIPKVLCLPLHNNLSIQDIDFISSIVKKTFTDFFQLKNKVS